MKKGNNFRRILSIVISFAVFNTISLNIEPMLTAKAIGDVAQIDSTSFSSLELAFQSIQQDDTATVTLLQNTEVTSPITVKGNVTLVSDGNYTIKSSSSNGTVFLIDNSSSLTIGRETPETEKSITFDGYSEMYSKVSPLIKNYGLLTLYSDIIIQNNRVIGDGGAIANEANATAILNGTKIFNCEANSGGGILNYGNLTLNNSQIINCEALSGGGIYNGGIVCITDSLISENVGKNNGGGVYNASGTNVNFTMNGNSVISKNSSSYGAGIYNLYNATFIMNNGKVTENIDTFDGSATAQRTGTGVCNDGIFIMENGEISKNDGGVFNFVMAKFTINDGKITENTSFINGGGISNRGILTINGGEIFNNTSPLTGGGVYNWSTCYMNGGKIYGNHADVGNEFFNLDIFNFNSGTIGNDPENPSKSILNEGVLSIGTPTLRSLRNNTSPQLKGNILIQPNTTYSDVEPGIVLNSETAISEPLQVFSSITEPGAAIIRASQGVTLSDTCLDQFQVIDTTNSVGFYRINGQSINVGIPTVTTIDIPKVIIEGNTAPNLIPGVTVSVSSQAATVSISDNMLSLSYFDADKNPLSVAPNASGNYYVQVHFTGNLADGYLGSSSDLVPYTILPAGKDNVDDSSSDALDNTKDSSTSNVKTMDSFPVLIVILGCCLSLVVILICLKQKRQIK